jgi:glutamyl-tRNA synthetase
MMLSLLLLISLLIMMSHSIVSLIQGNVIRNNIRSISRFSRKSNIKMGMAPVRVRFAPSPTGSLHVGGARTALFNWLLAKKTGGKFLIRVEDTDEARSTRESEEMILGDIQWMKMNWDEGPKIGGPHGPYRQSERKDIYKKFADQLIAEGKAYRCFCSEEELDKKREEAEAKGLDPKYDGTWRDADPAEVQKKLDAGEPYTVRFRVPEGKVVFIDDIVRGRVTWDADASLGDFIILRSSGMPVYNFCVAVDDATMEITHVIRAEEHLTNTLRQMLILEALNYKPPTYAHCSLILGSDRSKLSKRHGATSVKQFSEQGFLPEAMMNYLANLGWNDGTDKEIYSPDELIQAFDLNRIIKSAAVFDMDKLKWINGQHLKAMSLEKITPLITETLTSGETPVFDSNAAFSKEFLAPAVKIAQKDMELIVDARRLISDCLTYKLDETIASDSHVMEVLENEEGLETIIKTLIRDYDAGTMPKGNEETFQELWKTYMKNLGKELGLKGKGLFHPVRLCLTGRMSGPEISDQLSMLTNASGIPTSLKITSLADRIAQLKSFSVTDAKKIAKASVSA